MPSLRSMLAAAIVILLSIVPVNALQFPLSDTAARSAYFLGQRRDSSTGEFLARYTKHLPPPKTGPYVSDITFFTPFAQMVEYSSHQGIYSAQQAEIDGRNSFSDVQVSVYVYYASQNSFPGSMIRPPASDIDPATARSWRNYSVRVFDGKEIRQPVLQRGESQLRCSENGCVSIGTVIHLFLPAELFSSDSATVEVATPDGQSVAAEFDLDALR
jgi:hypothetical protein